MAADYSRIHRLLKILTLIQAQPGWTAPRLAEECGVTVRTVYRDLDMLKAAGIPHSFDSRTQGYQIRRDFFMQPIELTLDESLALIALGEHIGGSEQIPFTKAASRAVSKIRGQLPDAIRRELDDLDRHLAIKLAQVTPAEGIADVYDKVRQAIGRRCVLRCAYESPAGRPRGAGVTPAPTPEPASAPAASDASDAPRSTLHAPPSAAPRGFLFHPYTLFFSQRAWYVLGYHAGHQQVRCLKLNRFADLELTDEAYTVPAEFSLQEHLGQAWRMIRGAKRYAVELHFDSAVADTVADTAWHATQEVAWQEDGSIHFTCQVDGLDEIVWWVLSYGPHCVVKQPPELAAQVQTLAREILHQYGS